MPNDEGHASTMQFILYEWDCPLCGDVNVRETDMRGHEDECEECRETIYIEST